MKLLSCTLLLLCCYLFCPARTLYTGPTISPSGNTDLCPGQTVQLSVTGVTSTPANTSYQWKKDGTNITSGGTNATYPANATGSYTVIVTESGTPTETDPITITVHAPAAGFTFSTTGLCPSVPIQFTNTSTGSNLTYAWNFGDANSSGLNTSTDKDPAHRFIGSAGDGNQNFSVTLAVKDQYGCTASIPQNLATKQSPKAMLMGPSPDGAGFKNCSSISSPVNFSFSNLSSSSTNVSYRIIWGDASADFLSASMSGAVSHNYALGYFPMQFIVTGTNGCIDTASYYVFAGTNPAIGLSNPGNTAICSGTTLTFPVSNTASNPPGTKYIIEYNDGTPRDTLLSAPLNVSHQFIKTSCGTSAGSSFPNAFSATITATNPCAASAATVVPIRVSQAPIAVISSPSDTIVCINSSVTFTDMSIESRSVDANGNCIPGKAVWTISGSSPSDWTLYSGSLGNDPGASPSYWTNGTSNITIIFKKAGTYTIRLKVGNENCGQDYTEKIICVNPPTTADFTPSQTSGCGPLSITTTNNSSTPNCGQNKYIWSVSYASNTCDITTSSYSYTGGTDVNSTNPSLQFNNPGTYSVQLTTMAPGGNGCQATKTIPIVVKGKPAVTLNALAHFCQNATLQSTATYKNCNSTPTDYNWDFTGATPATATGATPPTVVYTTASTYTRKLSVTNECGTTTVSDQIIIDPTPGVTVPANNSYCKDVTIPTTNFPTPGTITYTWTNNNTNIGLASSGTGNVPQFIAKNTGTTPITATIIVTPKLGTCTGQPQSYTITVNPVPGKPSASASISYCINATATALTANAVSGNTINWYDNSGLTSGSTTAPTPLTTSTGTTSYYVTQTNSYNCESDFTKIDVTIQPAITGNAVLANEVICVSGSTPAQIKQDPASTLSGGAGPGTYTYQWQQSTVAPPPGTWSNTTSGTGASYQPPALSTTTYYKRIATSGACQSESNVITKTVLSAITGTNITGVQTICANTSPTLINGQAASGGAGSFNYSWENSTDNNTWNSISSQSGQDYQPPALNTTMFYRRITNAGTCNAISNAIKITVNPLPAGNVTAQTNYCNDVIANLTFSATAGTAPFTISMDYTDPSAASQTFSQATTGTSNPYTVSFLNTGSTPGNYTYTVTKIKDANGCENNGPFSAKQFTVTQKPVVNAVTATPVICAGQSAILTASGATTYQWAPSASLSASTGSTVTATPINTTTYTVAGTTNGCTTNNTVAVTVNAATPAAQAGPNTHICAGTSYTLQGVLPSGTTGMWTQPPGQTAAINDPSLPNTSVTGLQAGNAYQFTWTLTGAAVCPTTNATVTITNDGALTNTLNSAPPTVCSGQSVTVSGPLPTGGSGTYSYSWEQSADNVSNWTTIGGQSGSSITFTPSGTTYIRRKVTTSTCIGVSNSILITVQAAVSSNTIAGDQAICTGTNAATITGSLPVGGDGNYQFQWEMNTTGNTWTTIANAQTANYSPGVLTATTRYRRLATTNLCAGSQASTSAIITVTVNPDAIAAYTYAKLQDCAPFVLTAQQIVATTDPSRNNNYLWYAEGTQIGAGATFPGYTIGQPGTSVNIKLKGISRYGCKNDSVNYTFSTPALPTINFSTDLTEGCGPLAVQLTNTSTGASGAVFSWNFGDGTGFSGAAPGTHAFAPNPRSGDTTYHVTLSVLTACKTLTATKDILVHAKPKALFTPDKSTGCSPLSIQLNNTSAGIGNTYQWDFGDGQTMNNAPTSITTHIYHTGNTQQTFKPTLTATNACGTDALQYTIVVSPNAIQLDMAINGTEAIGCAQHTVHFINNTKGATQFAWDFNDGSTTNTIKNIDTVTHIFNNPGSYTVTLHATNGCSDTTTTETVVVHATPKAAYTISATTNCIGEAFAFTSQSTGAGNLLWLFGDNSNSTLTAPTHSYNTGGNFTTSLIASQAYADGKTCSDTTNKPVAVTLTKQGTITTSNLSGTCVPFNATFTGQHTVPVLYTAWDFSTAGKDTGLSVQHIFTVPGTYPVTMRAQSPGGCIYTATTQVVVTAPAGTVGYDHGINCGNTPIQFTVNAISADSIRYSFGNGITLTQETTPPQTTTYYTYPSGGNFLPSVALLTKGGCVVPLIATDTIHVDKLSAGFTPTLQYACDSSILLLKDTSRTTTSVTTRRWTWGDGKTDIDKAILQHTYAASGNYPVTLQITTASGCSATATQNIPVTVHHAPAISIQANAKGCTNQPVSYTAILHGGEAATLLAWSQQQNQLSGNDATFSFNAPGNYQVRLIAGTAFGCYDTLYHTVHIDTTPNVRIGQNQLICKGKSVALQATGAINYQWSPLDGSLSCTTCTQPVATPAFTTQYKLTGISAEGCRATDSMIVTVVQPFKIGVSKNDTLCIGQQTRLSVQGAATYIWSPSISLDNPVSATPIASPTVTTNYQVVGFDAFHCFTDTAHIIVAVGAYPTIKLAPDTTLATGTLYPLRSIVTNGPIKTWVWEPSADLDCSNCALPTAHIKKDVCYNVTATNIYGCPAKDTTCIHVFCANTQVYIPNAFTPDQNGHNDVLMVRGKGIMRVKSFRIFNRWGQIVFEKTDINPNDRSAGWDGMIKGQPASPEVYVYTCEVICENGTTYTYKGNVTLLK